MSFVRYANQTISDYPELMKEWHPTRNIVEPSEVTIGSDKKIWWVCALGHEWQAAAYFRARRGTKCPYCSGNKVWAGYNDLASNRPHLEKEWNYALNDNLLPEQVNTYAKKKVWWICKLGHEWQASIASRSNLGRNCPYCSNQKVLAGYNDLATTAPELLREYSPKNLLPASAVTARGKVKLLWVCSKGHEWSATGSTRKVAGCPQCVARTYVSEKEKAVLAFLESEGFSVITSDKKLIGQELDMYIPDKHLAIEFNGVYWHSNARKRIYEEYHYDKYAKCKTKNVQLIQIWEDDWDRNSDAIKNLILNRVKPKLPNFLYTSMNSYVQMVTNQDAYDFMLQHSPFKDEHLTASYYGVYDERHLMRSLLGVYPSDDVEHAYICTSYITEEYHNDAMDFSTLLCHIENMYSPDVLYGITYNDYENGDLYQQHGFLLHEESRYETYYVQNNKKVTQNSQQTPNPRVAWTSGKTTWRKTYGSLYKET